MSAEYILDALCKQSSLTAFFGDRIACGQLPQETDRTQPCLIYEIIHDGGRPNVNLLDGKDRSRCLARITVLAKTQVVVVQGQALVDAAINKIVNQVWANRKVMLVLKVNQSQSLRDEAVGVWGRADDYDMQYHEAILP